MEYRIQELVYKENKIFQQVPSKIASSQNRIAVIIHVFYIDIWQEELFPSLSKIDIPYDLYVTVPESMEEHYILEMFNDHPGIHIYQTENRGRDVLPFLQVMKLIGTDSYNYLCKLHTKKTENSIRGRLWRKLLYFDLIGSHTTVENTVKLFDENDDIGIITGKNTILSAKEFDYGNKNKVQYLSELTNIELPEDYLFPAGTMFWMRAELIEPLLSLFIENSLEFEDEAGQMDNTIAHAIERFIGALCNEQNKTIAQSPSIYSTMDEEVLVDIIDLVLTAHPHPNQALYIQHLENLVQSMRIKNRLRRVIPKPIRTFLKQFIK